MRNLRLVTVAIVLFMSAIALAQDTRPVPSTSIRVPEPATIVLGLAGAAATAAYAKFRKRR